MHILFFVFNTINEHSLNLKLEVKSISVTIQKTRDTVLGHYYKPKNVM